MSIQLNDTLHPTTIITGCRLYDREQDREVWGDLWNVGGNFLFNACVVQGESDWKPINKFSEPERPGKVEKTLTANLSCCFERRGVIVIPYAAAPVLNYNAQIYLKGSHV